MPMSGAEPATTKKTMPSTPSRPDLRVEAGAEVGAEVGVSVMKPKLLFELGWIVRIKTTWHKIGL